MIMISSRASSAGGKKYLERYRLPAWEEIPDFGLYMEQVVHLLKQYLSYLPPELKQSQTITAAAINNYVRTKMLPEPRKRSITGFISRIF